MRYNPLVTSADPNITGLEPGELPRFTIYHKITGSIWGVIGGVLGDLSAMVDFENEGLISGEYSSEDYWAPNGVPEPRPELAVKDSLDLWADDQDIFWIDEVPPGTEYQINWLEVSREHDARDTHIGAVDDGKLEWSTAIPGRYSVTLTPPFPFKILHVNVTAHEITNPGYPAAYQG